MKPMFTNVLFWRKLSSQPIAENLTNEQKRKYRNQYLKVMVSTFLIAFVYISSMVYIIKQFFLGEFWMLAVFLVLARDFYRVVFYSGEEIALIEERIERRAKKNKRQNEEGNR